MYFTLEADYAVRIVHYLAENKQKVKAEQISNNTGVTLRFTSKILRELVKADIIKSYKGTNGGYVLSKEPKQISLLQVLEAVDGRYGISRCVIPDLKYECNMKSSCTLHRVYAEISQKVRKELEDYSFDKLIKVSKT